MSADATTARRDRRDRAPLALRILGVVVALWLLAPIAVVIPLSLTGARSFVFPPESWSTEWYEALFGDPAWRDALMTSLKLALLVVVASGVLGTACALGLDRGRIPGRGLVRMFVLTPLVVPVVVVAVGVYAVFLPWRLVGNDLGFVLAHTVLALPFAVVAVSTSLAGFDRRFEQAAASLGASPATTFATVTLPLIAPGVFAGAVFAFITSFDELVIALFLSGPFKQTLPVQMYDSLEAIDPTIAAASTVMLLATTAVILLALTANRRLREQGN